MSLKPPRLPGFRGRGHAPGLFINGAREKHQQHLTLEVVMVLGPATVGAILVGALVTNMLLLVVPNCILMLL